MPALKLPPYEQVPGNSSDDVNGILYEDPAAAANLGAMYVSITDSSGALSASYAGSVLPGSGTNTIIVQARYDVISAALSSLIYTAKIGSGSDIISFNVWNQFGVETTGSIPVTIGTPLPSIGWVQSWAASPEPPDSGGDIAPSFNNQTVREVIRLSGGGTSIRLRFSDQFQTTPLAVGSVHIGLLDANGAIIAGTDHGLTFSGSNSTSIPAGSTVTSDPLSFATGQNSLLAVSIYLPQNTGPVTWNQFGGTSPIVAGNQTGAASLPSTNATSSRPILSAAEVSGGGVDGAIIALGDSITVVDPAPDQNDRWTDDLSNRLQSAGVSDLAVVNAGISGNRVLLDGTGPSALSRFSRDVTLAPGAKYVIIEEGINDIGSGNASAQDLEAGYVQLINAAHAAGLKVFGTTITPFGGSFYDTLAHEAVRDAVNGWIRTNGAFDAVIDFDSAVRDPQNLQWWRVDYDNGSHLHPNTSGTQALANAINLNLFGISSPSIPPITMGSGSDTLVLHMAEDAYQGDAQFTASIDGVQLGGTFATTALRLAGVTQDFIFKGDWAAGTHTVRVNFLNDLFQGTPDTDRNLYVDGVTYDGATVPNATAALMSAGPRDFAFTDSSTVSTPKNTTIGSGPDSLVLKVSQDAFQGSAQYSVSVDGKQIGGVLTASSLHGSGQDDTTTVKSSFATGTHTLTVNFLNDLYAGTPSTDRNLYVDGLAFNGTAVPGATAALMSAGPQNFAFAGRPTVSIAPTDTDPVVNLSHADIVATSGNHSLFIGGSFDTARLTGGTEGVLAFEGHNTIVTGAGNDTIRIAGTGNVVNAGGGINHLEDSGSGNRIIMPTIGGFDDVFGFVLQNGDTLDFRPALSKTAWDGSSAMLGNFLKVTMSGVDAKIALASTAGGGFIDVAALHASGNLDLAGLLTHAIV